MLPDLPVFQSTNTKQHFDRLRADHRVATRCADGTFGMVYFPQAEQSLKVGLGFLKAPVIATWYDPRNGKSHLAASLADEHPNGMVTFTSSWAGSDWVLVLDAVTEGY